MKEFILLLLIMLIGCGGSWVEQYKIISAEKYISTAGEILTITIYENEFGYLEYTTMNEIYLISQEYIYFTIEKSTGIFKEIIEIRGMDEIK